MDNSPLIELCYRMYEDVLGKGHPDQRLPVSPSFRHRFTCKTHLRTMVDI